MPSCGQKTWYEQLEILYMLEDEIQIDCGYRRSHFAPIQALIIETHLLFAFLLFEVLALVWIARM